MGVSVKGEFVGAHRAAVCVSKEGVAFARFIVDWIDKNSFHGLSVFAFPAHGFILREFECVDFRVGIEDQSWREIVH